MKRVFVLSDHPLFGQGIENLLGEDLGLEVVGRETSLERAIERIRQLRPDVILADLGDPGGELAPATMRLMKEGLGAKIIGLNLQDNTISIYRREQRVVREVEDLVDAIEHDDDRAEPVTAKDWAALAASRSRVYGFLAAIYNRLPDPAFVESLMGPEMSAFLSSLAGNEDLPEGMREGLGLIEDFIRDSRGKEGERLLTDLGVDRTRLLRGVQPGYGPPPPYESVYAGSEEAPLMQARASVRQIYAAAGLALREEARDQPDFIGFELDFMRHLTAREAQSWADAGGGGAVGVLEQEKDFLDQHIGHWIPRYCDVMAKEARLSFYEGIAKLTKGFVQDEAERVAEYLEWGAAAASG